MMLNCGSCDAGTLGWRGWVTRGGLLASVTIRFVFIIKTSSKWHSYRLVVFLYYRGAAQVSSMTGCTVCRGELKQGCPAEEHREGESAKHVTYAKSVYRCKRRTPPTPESRSETEMRSSLPGVFTVTASDLPEVHCKRRKLATSHEYLSVQKTFTTLVSGLLKCPSWFFFQRRMSLLCYFQLKNAVYLTWSFPCVGLEYELMQRDDGCKGKWWTSIHPTESFHSQDLFSFAVSFLTHRTCVHYVPHYCKPLALH